MRFCGNLAANRPIGGDFIAKWQKNSFTGFPFHCDSRLSPPEGSAALVMDAILCLRVCRVTQCTSLIICSAFVQHTSFNIGRSRPPNYKGTTSSTEGVVCCAPIAACLDVPGLREPIHLFNCFSNNDFFIQNDHIFHCLNIPQSSPNLEYMSHLPRKFMIYCRPPFPPLGGAIIKESAFWLITHIYFV